MSVYLDVLCVSLNQSDDYGNAIPICSSPIRAPPLPLPFPKIKLLFFFLPFHSEIGEC